MRKQGMARSKEREAVQWRSRAAISGKVYPRCSYYSRLGSRSGLLGSESAPPSERHGRGGHGTGCGPLHSGQQQPREECWRTSWLRRISWRWTSWASLRVESNSTAQVKRLNAAARCMTVYQQGLLALHKMRQNGQQRIMVQYVNVSHGSQAVIENIERDSSRDVESQPAMPTR